MPISSDSAQLKIKLMNGWVLSSRIGPVELIFKPHIDKH